MAMRNSKQTNPVSADVSVKAASAHNANRMTKQQQHHNDKLVAGVVMRAEGLCNNNASPSSSQQKQCTGFQQVRPLSTLVEDPLDLTVVQEDSSPRTNNNFYRANVGQQAKDDELDDSFAEAEEMAVRGVMPIRQSDQQKKRTVISLQTRQFQSRTMQQPGGITTSSTTAKMSRSPSSSAATISPSAEIEDIKNASLYDLIKLQMMNQQRLKKSKDERRQSPVRSEVQTRTESSPNNRSFNERKSKAKSSKQTPTKEGVGKTRSGESERGSNQQRTSDRGIAGNYSRIKASTGRSHHRNPEDVTSDTSNFSQTRIISSNQGQQSFLQQNSKPSGKVTSTLASRIEQQASRIAGRPQKPQTSLNSTTKVTNQINRHHDSITPVGKISTSSSKQNPQATKLRNILTPKSQASRTGRQSQQSNFTTTTAQQSYKDNQCVSRQSQPEGETQLTRPISKKLQMHQQKVASELSQPKTRNSTARLGLKSTVSSRMGSGKKSPYTAQAMRRKIAVAPENEPKSLLKFFIDKEDQQSVTSQTQPRTTQLNISDLEESQNLVHTQQKTVIQGNKKIIEKPTKVSMSGQPQIVVNITSDDQYQQSEAASSIKDRFKNSEQEQCAISQGTVDNTTNNDVFEMVNSQHLVQNTNNSEADNQIFEGQQTIERVVVTPGRVTRAQRSRSRSERISTMKPKQKSNSRDRNVPPSQIQPVVLKNNFFEEHQQQQQESLWQKHNDLDQEKEKQKMKDYPQNKNAVEKLVQHDSIKIQRQTVTPSRQSGEKLINKAVDSSATTPRKHFKLQPDAESNGVIPQLKIDRVVIMKTPEAKQLKIQQENKSSDYLMIEKQQTTVEMFEVGLLKSIEDLKTERGEENDEILAASGKKQVDQEQPFQPSPVKFQSQAPRRQFLSRKSIKNLLNQFDISYIQDIVRIKKPQKSSQLIGQLFCMLIWICKEASAPAGTTDQLPEVPFQNLEDEFSSWENVQSYLNQNTLKLYQELQNMLQLFPLPSFFVDNYLRKMQHKIQIETRCLSRISSVSLDRAFSLIQGAIDWHCKPLSSFEQYTDEKPQESNENQLSNTRPGAHQINPEQQQQMHLDGRKSLNRSFFANKASNDNSCTNRFAEQSRRHLQNKYPKLKQPLNKSSQNQVESPHSKDPRQRISHQFKQGPSAEKALEARNINNPDTEDNLVDLRISNQNKQNSMGLGQVESPVLRANFNNKLSASPTSQTRLFGAAPSLASNIVTNQSKAALFSSTVSSRNKMAATRSVTHFSRQQMVSPPAAQYRNALLNNVLTRPSLMNASVAQSPHENLRMKQTLLMAAGQQYPVDLSSDENDEPINLVLQNGVTSRKTEDKQVESLQQNNDFVVDDEKRDNINDCQQQWNNYLQSDEIGGQAQFLENTNNQNNNNNLLFSIKPTEIHQTSGSEIEENKSDNSSQLAAAGTADNYNIKVYHPQRQNKEWTDKDSDDSFSIEPTNVGQYYERQEQLHNALISRRYSPSPNSQQLRGSQKVAIQDPDQTRQMIRELREKHLKLGSNMLPASPMSNTALVVAPQQLSTDQNNINLGEKSQIISNEDIQESLLQDEESNISMEQSQYNQQPPKTEKDQLDISGSSDIKLRSQSSRDVVTGSIKQKQNFSYNEWQKKNFDNILEQLNLSTTTPASSIVNDTTQQNERPNEEKN